MIFSPLSGENFSSNGFSPRHSFRQQMGKMVCYVWRTIAEVSNNILLITLRIRRAVSYLFSSDSCLTKSLPPIGGVTNVGNSCYISLVLQQFAAEPEFFNLEFCDEANELKEKMMICIEAIRQSRQVSKAEMHDLLKALSENDWVERPGEPGDPLNLLTFIATIFKINQFSYDQFIADTTQDPVVYVTDTRSKVIETLYHPKKIKVLWIINNPNSGKSPRETIQTKTHALALREIHMTETSHFGRKHMYCMRKVEDTWYRCNDEEIREVALQNMPTSHMRRLVYLAIPTEA